MGYWGFLGTCYLGKALWLNGDASSFLKSTLDLTIQLDIHVHEGDYALHFGVSYESANAVILGVLCR